MTEALPWIVFICWLLCTYCALTLIWIGVDAWYDGDDGWD